MSELRQRRDVNKATSRHSDSSRNSTPADDDNEPRIRPTASAFSAFDGDIAASSERNLSGPTSQSMDATDSTHQHNGARLNLSPELRAAFQKRKQELLEKYPDMMTRDISGDASRPDDGGFGCRLDHLFLLFLFGLLCYLLYVEYGINVPLQVGGFIQRMLDPGPIQRGDAAGEAEEAYAGGEAAIRAVQQRMRQSQGQQ